MHGKERGREGGRGREGREGEGGGRRVREGGRLLGRIEEGTRDGEGGL